MPSTRKVQRKRISTKARQAYAKPLPLMEGLSKEFYDWCKQHELRFQRCAECRAWRHVPREMCAACGSRKWKWAKSRGRGNVFTWTVTARPMHPAFQDDAPSAQVVIEMKEGVRILSDVINCKPDRLEIGMPVDVVFDDVTPEVTLPRFRRAPARRRRTARKE